MESTVVATNSSQWLELLKYHGVPTFLILAGIYVFIKYWIPMKRDETEAAKAAEVTRLEGEAKHKADLVAEIKLAREEGRNERDKLRQEQRDTEERQNNMFREMVNRISSSIDGNTQELRRNSALTVASAEILGAQKKAVEQRANELAPEAHKQ